MFPTNTTTIKSKQIMSSFTKTSAPTDASTPDLYYSRDDLDQIRKVYVKKAPYVKNPHETKNVEVGSAKRNIQRSGGNPNHKSGKNMGGKKKLANDLIDDGSTYDYYADTTRNMDEHDPNFDSEVSIIVYYYCLL